MSTFNLVEIVKNDWATYYNFGSGKSTPPIGRTIIITLVAASLALLEHSDQTAFLNAVLSVEAILVGFSFSVMFFLLSENNVADQQDAFLETEIRRDKLQKLSREIFYNVSYFNLVSIISVITALLLLIPNYDFIPKDIVSYFENLVDFDLSIVIYLFDFLFVLGPVINWFIWACLYFFLAQSLFTLIRTIGRVHFYFSEKISLSTEDNS